MPKAFEIINHEILIAKLHAYGSDESSLKLLHSSLLNRWCGTKIDNKFSSWAKLLKSILEASVLNPLLVNIYLDDLFFPPEYTDVCNFADDTTFHACDKEVTGH